MAQDQGQTDEMKWNAGPQFNAEASHFSIPTWQDVIQPVD